MWLQHHLDALNGTSHAPRNATPNGSPVWDQLNAMISAGRSGLYTGGKGVLVRSLMDGLSSMVVPATFVGEPTPARSNPPAANTEGSSAGTRA